jgi:RimJ/RimL family protein N-acetyltransferase
MEHQKVSLIAVKGQPPGHGVVEFLWELLKEREAERWTNISHQNMPSMQEHLDYVGNHPYRAWYLIQNTTAELVGSISLSPRNEIGIHIARLHRRHGYASAAIKELLRTHGALPGVPGVSSDEFLANINPRNAASIALFERLGGIPLQITFRIPKLHEVKDAEVRTQAQA